MKVIINRIINPKMRKNIHIFEELSSVSSPDSLDPPELLEHTSVALLTCNSYQYAELFVKLLTQLIFAAEEFDFAHDEHTPLLSQVLQP